MIVEIAKTPDASWSLGELAEFVTLGFRKSAFVCWQIGKALSLAQSHLAKSGEFLKWLKGIGLTKSTAYRYMEVSSAYDQSDLEGLSVTEALRLLESDGADEPPVASASVPTSLSLVAPRRHQGASMSDRPVMSDDEASPEATSDDDESDSYSWAVNQPHELFQEAKLAIESITAALQAWPDFSDEERRNLTARLRMLWPQVAPLIGEFTAA